MTKYFGTDGVRAVAGQFPLVEDFIVKLGYCAMLELKKHGKDNNHPVIIAEDSRISGPSIAKHLTRGIRAAGFNVLHIGIAPTPAVSYLTKKYGAVCGIVISASHNPAEFNGIKFFSSEGSKLNEDIEQAIEDAVESTTSIPQEDPSTTATTDESKVNDYIDFLKSTVKHTDFKGIKVVLDCANGASYKVAPQVFADLGAQTVVINNNPDGLNINNNAGALHTQGMQDKTKEENAFMGFSFDGDADRLIASDEQGRQLDGDNIIAIAAMSLKEKGLLKGGKVALTIMANLGLINYLKHNGVTPILTKVGDKYVFEALDKEDLSLGGETSGHIIFKDIFNTGDGILCALQTLALIKESGHKPAWFKDLWQKYPLKLVQVKVDKKTPLEEVEGFISYVAELEKSMGEKGRIVVRYSGTEPLLRILVEGEDKTQVEDFAQKTADFYKSKITA